MSTAADPPIRRPASLHKAEALLRDVWGYPHFRTHQRRVVVAALSGRDCLAVLPTGGGKSLCFQVPALLLPGLTIVVSPLISLMQDQVQALRKRGVPAAYLSSTQSAGERATVLRDVRAGAIKLLYVAPERLQSLGAPGGVLRPSLVVVDEAHCISEWGHEFRPHYRALGSRRRELGSPPTIALTATATPATRADIVQTLGLRRPVTVVQSFDRPNLRFAVRRVATERERLSAAKTALRSTTGTAIVYVPTRDRTDGVARYLRERGLSALPYHAGLPGPDRKLLLERFLDGTCRVMVATNAFGMGIDKPDVRLVLHLGVPSRPEAYFQEAGRAGRDGGPGRCELYWLPADLRLARSLAGLARDRRLSRTVRRARSRALQVMTAYVRTRRCRRRVLMEYLGQDLARCAGCDRCAPAAGNARSSRQDVHVPERKRPESPPQKGRGFASEKCKAFNGKALGDTSALAWKLLSHIS